MTKILIASNDIILLNTMSIFLQMENYDVTICSEPTDIYKKVLSFEPEIVFFDNDLEIENSRSLCNMVKNNIVTEHIRVIIYNNQKGKHLLDCKPDDCFLQPFSLSDLVKKVTKQANQIKKSDLRVA